MNDSISVEPITQHSIQNRHTRASVSIHPSGTPPYSRSCEAGVRRSSAPPLNQQPQKFVIHVETTLRELLAHEDTDHDTQITIDDHGPKVSPRTSFARHAPHC